MQRLRIVLATVIMVFALAGVSQSVFAGPATHHSVRLNNATIPWEPFPPPDGLSSFCSEIPAGVHINPDDYGSNRVKQATENVKPDGSKRVVISDLVKGTASDGNVSYKFVYENSVTYDFDGSTVNVAMKDTFKLKGGEVNYTVGFNWRWAYETESFVVTASPEDIVVNPFFFATDGDGEDPNIVPGSWQQLSTRGDPFNCDPL